MWERMRDLHLPVNYASNLIFCCSSFNVYNFSKCGRGFIDRFSLMAKIYHCNYKSLGGDRFQLSGRQDATACCTVYYNTPSNVVTNKRKIRQYLMCCCNGVSHKYCNVQYSIAIRHQYQMMLQYYARYLLATFFHPLVTNLFQYATGVSLFGIPSYISGYFSKIDSSWTGN